MMGAPEVVTLNLVLMTAIGAKNILDDGECEFQSIRVYCAGLFTGFSALAAALVIPADGRVVGMDIDGRYYNTAGLRFAQQANVANKIDVRIAPASQTMRVYTITCTVYRTYCR